MLLLVKLRLTAGFFICCVQVFAVPCFVVYGVRGLAVHTGQSVDF